MKNNYDDIRPYGPGEVKPAVESLLRDRQFMTILRGFIPLPKSVIRFIIRTMFIGVNTPLDFQLRYMKHVVRYVLRKCSDGCTFGGHPLPSKEQHHTYLSNHRDIVLDSAILDLKLVEEGYDIVSGWKKQRFDNKFTKNIPSKLYNATARWVTGIKLHDMNCGLKAYRNEVVKNIEVYGEMHRYIPYLAKNAGFGRITEKPVQHQKRKYGVSKFGLERFVNGLLDLISLWFLSKFGKKQGIQCNTVLLQGILHYSTFTCSFVSQIRGRIHTLPFVVKILFTRLYKETCMFSKQICPCFSILIRRIRKPRRIVRKNVLRIILAIQIIKTKVFLLLRMNHSTECDQ